MGFGGPHPGALRLRMGGHPVFFVGHAGFCRMGHPAGWLELEGDFAEVSAGLLEVEGLGDFGQWE